MGSEYKQAIGSPEIQFSSYIEYLGPSRTKTTSEMKKSKLRPPPRSWVKWSAAEWWVHPNSYAKVMAELTSPGGTNCQVRVFMERCVFQRLITISQMHAASLKVSIK